MSDTPKPEVVLVPAVRNAEGNVYVGLPEDLTRDNGGGVWVLDEGGVGYHKSTDDIREMADEMLASALGDRDAVADSVKSDAAQDWVAEATEHKALLHLLADEVDAWKENRDG